MYFQSTEVETQPLQGLLPITVLQLDALSKTQPPCLLILHGENLEAPAYLKVSFKLKVIHAKIQPMLKNNTLSIFTKIRKTLPQVLVLRFPILTVIKSSQAFRKCNVKLRRRITAILIVREVSHIF